MQPHPATAVAPRPWSRRLLSIAASLLAFLVAFVSTVLSSSGVGWFHDPTQVGPGGDPLLNDAGAVAAMAAVLLTFAVFLRRRRPWVVFWLGAVIALVLQFDMVVMLVGLSEIVARRDRRQWRLAAAGALLVAIVLAARNTLFHEWGPLIRVSGPGQAFVHVVVLGSAYAVAFGLGWLRRSREQVELAENRAEAVQQRADTLNERLAQQDERERLAREIHDALAHRLSLVSLHSGALEEAARSGDARVSEAAHVVRDNAHRSLEDLRDLIGALRDPKPAGPVEEPVQVPRYGMADVADVIDSTMAAGITVNAFVMLCDPQEAGELLNRAVFRLTQEALTNVVKHAPGSTVGLDLRASPEQGVSLVIRNRLTATAADVPGSGNGLIGMRERVGMLDGQLSAGPTGDGWFEVRAALPWRSHADEASVLL